jgi:hypothetical protein
MAEPPRPARPSPGEPLLVVVAVLVAVYVVLYPFTRARYPPLTDLPFHAAQASILRHYFDPAFHFREQFTVHPLEVPYVSMYMLGAAAAFVFPITTSAKLMAIVMLGLVPAGLAVLLAGMKKSPLWAISGLGLTWCTVAQWGFLNYLGATGLLAMSIGFAFMVVDAPTPWRRVALGASVVAIFFTHVYRFPFAVAGVLLAGVCVFPSTKRFSVLLAPLAPGVVLFLAWLVIRPPALAPGLGQLAFHGERFGRILEHSFGSYAPMMDGVPESVEGASERRIAGFMAALTALAVVLAAVFRRVAARAQSPAERAWSRGTTTFALLYAAGLFLLYLTLPLDVGQWFYVYPREIIAVALFLLAAVPDLPRPLSARAGFVALLSVAVIPMAAFVAQRFSDFEAATADFRELVQTIRPAPRLLYLVYWLGGSQKRASPFLHLPAWIQAEKGGALGFHFAEWGFYPVRYREGSPDVPPPFEPGFEWSPERFDVARHGPWFDTFLVRHQSDPTELFDRDPTIHRVAHHGTWWLYERRPR